MYNGVESNVRRKTESNGKSRQFSLLNVISQVGSKREEKQNLPGQLAWEQPSHLALLSKVLLKLQKLGDIVIKFDCLQ